MKRIRTLNQLHKLALNHKTVVWRGIKPKPAAFMMGMPARTILMFIERGLYEYKKIEKIYVDKK